MWNYIVPVCLKKNINNKAFDFILPSVNLNAQFKDQAIGFSRRSVEKSQIMNETEWLPQGCK